MAKEGRVRFTIQRVGRVSLYLPQDKLRSPKSIQYEKKENYFLSLFLSRRLPGYGSTHVLGISPSCRLLALLMLHREGETWPLDTHRQLLFSLL